MTTTPMNLAMTADRAGVTESGKEIPVGTTVEYVAHVPGGMVKVRVPAPPALFAQRLDRLHTEMAILASEVQAVGHPDDETSYPTQAAFRHLAEASRSMIMALDFLKAHAGETETTTEIMNPNCFKALR